VCIGAAISDMGARNSSFLEIVTGLIAQEALSIATGTFHNAMID